MEVQSMIKGAETLVDVCARVKVGETVLIISDVQGSKIAEAIFRTVVKRKAEPVTLVMNRRVRDGEEPPHPVAEIMKRADVVFLPVNRSITHTHAVKNASAAGTRLVVMTGFSEEMMVRGGLEADFRQLKPVCRGLAEKFGQGKQIRLTTPGGTNLSMDIDGRRGNALYCMVEPGEFSTVPTVEANVSPVEATANGVIVADASIPYLGIGVLEAPVTFVVKDGFITDISGGKQADILAENLAAQNDPNVYNIAEIGVGLNPECRMCGIMLEDEGVISTCHIGIGTSITLGGNVKAAVHYDLLMWDPVVKVDGHTVIHHRTAFYQK